MLWLSHETQVTCSERKKKRIIFPELIAICVQMNLFLIFLFRFSPSTPFSSRQNGSLQLSPASQSLLKNQQIILNGTQQRIVVPKLNIRMETQTQGKINGADLLSI